MTENSRPCVLVVDDETSIRESFLLILQDQYSVFQAASGEAAVKKVVDSKIDLVFLDIRMPGIDGIETLKKIKDIDDSIEVVMVTAVNDIQKAGEAIRIGANNYIVKPFDVDQILLMTKALTGKKILKHETKVIRGSAKPGAGLPELPGISKHSGELQKKIDKLSSSDSPVLITGERGCEAEDVGRLIHLKSKRKDSPFRIFRAPIGVPDNILYDGLFGSGKGAFLNALEKGTGIFEEASGGSVLLMNIGELPSQLQEALADIMEQKSFSRQGSSSPLSFNVRLMFFSQKSPDAGKEESLPAPRLSSSLKNNVIELAPLRQRKEDIPSLVNSCLEELNAAYGRSFKDISPEALEVLTEYDWPGNAAELRLYLKGIISSRSLEAVRLLDLPLHLLAGARSFSSMEESKSLSYNELSSKFEKEFIYGVLKRSGFDLQKASHSLNISKNALASKIESLEIS